MFLILTLGLLELYIDYLVHVKVEIWMADADLCNTTDTGQEAAFWCLKHRSES
jgi:hypothetical protein